MVQQIKYCILSDSHSETVLGLQCLREEVEFQFIEVFVHFFIIYLSTETVATPDYFET